MPSMLKKHSISADLAIHRQLSPEGVSSRSQVRDSRGSRRHYFTRGVRRGGVITV